MPSAQAHLPDDEAGHREAGAAPDEEHPILLEEIDAALRRVGRCGRRARGRIDPAWRDSLTRVLETLTLRTRGARGRREHPSPSPGDRHTQQQRDGRRPAWRADGPLVGRGLVGARRHPGAAELDPGIFVRSDDLLAVHAEMASVDLTSVEDVRRVLGVLEEQVAALTTRQEAVEARLREIRAAIAASVRGGGDPHVEPAGLRRPAPAPASGYGARCAQIS